MNLKIGKPFIGTFPVTFRFGEKPGWYIKAIGYPHNGIDFGCPQGTRIVAVDAGAVSQVGNHPRGWGLFVRVQHVWGMSHYAHLSKQSVKVGDTVKEGQELGESGNTGFTTGPHVHFGMKRPGQGKKAMHHWIDPEPYFEGVETEETIRCPACGTVFPLKK